MNDDQQRIAIAEACGWEDCHSPAGTKTTNGLPDYLNDLNAMHEAFLSLSEVEKIVFAETLCTIMEENVVDWGYYSNEQQIEWNSIATMINATSRQRAEAFLHTKGLWHE